MGAKRRIAAKARYRARKQREGSFAGQLDARLEELSQAAGDLSDAWPDVAQVWHERQTQIFASDSNGRWAPLKPATILKKHREGSTLAPLRETGTLFREVTSRVPRSSSKNFVVLGPSKGAHIEYAKHHMRGNGVPQRHPVPRFTPTEMRRMVEKVRDHMGMGK